MLYDALVSNSVHINVMVSTFALDVSFYVFVSVVRLNIINNHH